MKLAIVILGILFVGLFVFGLIIYFSDRPTGTEAFATDQIQTAVSALFTANAPTPTTVSTETVTSSGPTTEELAYLTYTVDEFTAFGEIVSDIHAKHDEAVENTFLFFDNEWRSEIITLLESLQLHAKNFSQYTPVPPRLSSLNDAYDGIYSETILLVANYTAGVINDIDSGKMNAAIINLQNIAAFIEDVNDALAAFIDQ